MQVEYVSLLSSDGHKFIVQKEIAQVSNYIRSALFQKQIGADKNTVQLDIKMEVLEVCIQYFHYKYKYQKILNEKGSKGQSQNFVLPEFKIEPTLALGVLQASLILQC